MSGLEGGLPGGNEKRGVHTSELSTMHLSEESSEVHDLGGSVSYRRGREYVYEYIKEKQQTKQLGHSHIFFYYKRSLI